MLLFYNLPPFQPAVPAGGVARGSHVETDEERELRELQESMMA